MFKMEVFMHYIQEYGFCLFLLLIGMILVGIPIKYGKLSINENSKINNGFLTLVLGVIIIGASILMSYCKYEHTKSLSYIDWEAKWSIKVIEPGRTVDPVFEAVGKIIEENTVKKILFTASSNEWGIVKFTPSGKGNREPSKLRGRFTTQNGRKAYFDAHLDIDGTGFIAKIYPNIKDSHKGVILWVGKQIE